MTTEQPGVAGTLRHAFRRTCVGLALAVLLSTGLFGQEGAGVSEDDASDTDQNASQRVDESEESYRARMELRDQRFREQKRADMIYSRHGGTSKLDQLPEASQEHIKRQMREMIIASRQWKPGEDVSDYPYQPSAAAQTDATLRRQEREAWAEQLEKYQQREAAAYADAQRDGGDAADGNSATGSAAATQGAAQSKQAYSDEYRAENEEVAEISDAGVSENALSFVRGAGGQVEESVPSGVSMPADEAESASGSNSGTESGSTNPDAPAGSLTLDELASLQGMSAAPVDAAGLQPDGQMPAASSNASERPSSGSASQDVPTPSEDASAQADTLEIRDLQNLERRSLQDFRAGPGDDSAANGEDRAAIRTEEPGTLKIADLENLGTSDQPEEFGTVPEIPERRQ